MNIYTLVLDSVNNEPFIATYADPLTAAREAVNIARQYPSWEVFKAPNMYFQAILDDKGSRVYIKECELIGGDHD